MTPPQTQLYRHTWQAAAKAHGWNTKAGITAALAAHHAGQVWESPELTKLLATVYEIAENWRAVSADELRHACTAVAIGRHVSSKNFTNAEFDKVLALLRVLENPTSLKNQNALLNAGEAGERRRHVHVVTSADAPYWKRIAKDKFGHADLDRLSLAQLRQLSLTLRNRPKSAAYLLAA